MGSDDNFLQVVARNFDVLCLPLVTLAYPLYSSIRAIEARSLADNQQWLTYWVLYSIVTLFEITFGKPLEWFPIWPYAKLIATCWLVLPNFNGAAYVYNHFIRPFYMNPHSATKFWYVPRHKDGFRNADPRYRNDAFRNGDPRYKDAFGNADPRYKDGFGNADTRYKDVFRKQDDILTAAEKYMEQHGTEAFERMITKAEREDKGRRGSSYMMFDDDYMY